MAREQVRRFPVLNRDKRLVGIISLGDVAVMQDLMPRPLAGSRSRAGRTRKQADPGPEASSAKARL